MAITLSGNINVNYQALNRNTLTLVTGNINLNNSYSSAWDSTKVSKLYSAVRITTGEVLDLTSGLTDGFGNALVFSTWMAIFVQNNEVINGLTVGGGTTPLNGFTNATLIQAGGSISLNGVAGYTVDGTHKLFAVVTTASASQSYTLIIIGD